MVDEARFPGVRQRGRYWCVLACIENGLQYLGSSVGQEELFWMYCRQAGGREGAMVNPVTGAAERVHAEHCAEALERFPADIWAPQFVGYKELCEWLRDPDEALNEELRRDGIAVEFVPSLPDVDPQGYLRDRTSSQCIVLVSLKVNGNAHACVLLAVEEDLLRVFDPDSGQRRVEVAVLNADAMIVRAMN